MMIFRIATVAGVVALAAASNAAPILGCDAVNHTRVECSEILSATSTKHGVSFYRAQEYHVGFQRGVKGLPVVSGAPFNLPVHDILATSVAEPEYAEQGFGATMVTGFDARAALAAVVSGGLVSISNNSLDEGVSVQTAPSGAVPGGLTSTTSQSVNEGAVVETVDVIAVGAADEKGLDQASESERGDTDVDFGDVVPQISVPLVSRGGGLPGLTSGNRNLGYFTAQVPEPGSALLLLTGLGFLGLRRRLN